MGHNSFEFLRGAQFSNHKMKFHDYFPKILEYLLGLKMNFIVAPHRTIILAHLNLFNNR